MSDYLFELDYSEDYLKWLNKLEEYDIAGNDDMRRIKALQKEIINSNNPILAYYFSYEFSYENYKMQRIVINSNNPKYIYLYAKNEKNSDIQALYFALEKTKDIKHICKFACFIKNINKKFTEKALLKYNKAKYAHMYIKHVKPKSVNKFKVMILASKKPRYIYELAKRVNDVNELSIMEDILIDNRSYNYIRLFASKIKLANVDKLEQVILDSEDLNQIKKFAMSVKQSKMKAFLLSA